MAVTIDHLSAYHRYTVIRGFTDAKGVKVPFEAVGAIRKISLDPQMTELYIDWERIAADGARTPERLTFLMAATDGPRNNHMKEYFELGEVDVPPREPKAPKQTEPAEAASGSARTKASPDELTVACGCGPVFHRAIWPGGHLSVNACLRCGTVAVTRQIGDDGRHTGNAWTSYVSVPTDQKVVDWLARFPRASINYAGAMWRWPMSASLVRYPTLLYPADTRVADEEELKALEDTLWEAQEPMTRADRQRAALGDIPPPPQGMLRDFANSIAVQRVLGLRPNSDLGQLHNHANLLSASSELAASLLLRRDGAYDIMMGWLRSKDDEDFSAGIAMLRDSRPLFSSPDDPRLAPELLGILDDLPLGKLKDVPGRVESCLRFESLLVAVGDLGVNSAEMQEGLKALRKKLARKDATVTEAIGVILNELNGIDNRPEEYR